MADGTPATVTSVADALAGAEVIVLALPGAAVAGLTAEHGDALAGKLVIDATNQMGQPVASAPATRMLTSTRAGQPHNTDAIALPSGGHPNTIVVADDTTFVEHRGNAGRPHAAANHPSHTPGQRRSSSLRCKTTTPTDTNPNTTTDTNPHAPKNTSTRTPQTGNTRHSDAPGLSPNAGTEAFAVVGEPEFSLREPRGRRRRCVRQRCA